MKTLSIKLNAIIFFILLVNFSSNVNAQNTSHYTDNWTITRNTAINFSSGRSRLDQLKSALQGLESENSEDWNEQQKAELRKLKEYPDRTIDYGQLIHKEDDKLHFINDQLLR